MYSVNVEGVKLCFVHAARHFVKQGTGGKLLAASSIAGVQPLPFLSMYCATKVSFFRHPDGFHIMQSLPANWLQLAFC